MPLHSLRTKIVVSQLATTVFFALAMVIFAETVISRRLVDKLQEKGVAIARKVAADAVNPIITERYFEVAMAFRDLQDSETDFVYAFVVAEDGRELVQTFPGPVPAALRMAHPVSPLAKSSAKELDTDRGKVIDIAVPLLRGEIGVLRVGFSESAIHKDVHEIVLLIVAFAVLTLVVGTVAAIGLSRLFMRPLATLALAAERFGRGETQEKVGIRTRDEVGELAAVFNEMVENRERFEAERERLVHELQQSLAEVKVLRGFLPICSRCKRIRGGEGYWQQIESYISAHTEAEFSHGLCPECTQALYPEIWEKMQRERR
ncbi:MAG TPA: HAMP domain-containing protein [bacterium]